MFTAWTRAGGNAAAKARERFVPANQNLVRNIARLYRQLKDPAFDIDDLIQEGNIGLLKAIGNYNPQLARFRTYASNYVRGRSAERL